jgi:hypothetical protein
MEVHESPSKRDVFSWCEAEGLEDLERLEIKTCIAGGSCGQDVRDSAIRADACKKRGGIERVGILRTKDFARWLWEACGEFW